MILLENDHISLKPYAQDHVQKTVEWLRQPNIQESFGMLADVTVESHLTWLKSNEHVLKWAIYCKEYVGNLFLFENIKHRSAYFQIYIGENAHLSKGIGFNAMQLMLDYAFHQRNLHRIWMHCFPSNIPAIKLYEKLGFVLEGYERESICKNGSFVSQGRWSLLRQEWLNRGVSS